jgi:hypothetical protein
VSAPLLTIDTLIESIADRIADRVADRIASRPAADQRIPLGEVAAHGAPSVRWVTDRARLGLIAVHGPRGGRFVLLADLEALLSSTTIARRVSPGAASVPTSLDEAAHAAVVELAARRAKRTG